MSEDISSRATSNTPTWSPESPSSLAPEESARAMEVPTPQRHWGENEDQLLHRGDEAALKELESRMGKVFVRRRMQENLLSHLGDNT